jgi:hypothetical protein
VYLCALVIVNYWIGDIRVLLAGATAALLAEFAWQGWSGRKLRHWPRYVQRHSTQTPGKSDKF